MPANLIRNLHGDLIRTGRLRAHWKVDDFVQKGRFTGCPLRPRIWPDLDENDTDRPILPRLLAIRPLIVEANDHTRLRFR